MTDIDEFYKREYGCVINTAIDKYLYIMLNNRLDDKVRLVYSKLEEVQDIRTLKHPYVRQCLLDISLLKGKEIVISSDIPAKGSGLGSSSSTVVGLVHILSEMNGVALSKHQLAALAYGIEHDSLKYQGGKQDQYAATFGNLNYIQFNTEGNVAIEPIKISDQNKRKLEDSLILFYTGIQRDSKVLSEKITKKIPDKLMELRVLKDQVKYMKIKIESNHFDIENFGKELTMEWNTKKKIIDSTTTLIDKIFRIGIEAGAYGGKLCGGGKGGFIMFCCDSCEKDKLRTSLPNLRSLDIKFDINGSQILYNSAGG